MRKTGKLFAELSVKIRSVYLNGNDIWFIIATYDEDCEKRGKVCCIKICINAGGNGSAIVPYHAC